MTTPPAHVLVVEDNRDTLEMLVFMLQGWGYTVDGAANGTEALARMKVRCPDVVLSDLVMPGMDGMELLQAIRAMEDCPDLVFFLITGKGTVSDAVQAIAEGADECIIKPFESNALHAQLEARGFYGLPATT